jgi:hypothetical protein
MIQYNQLQEFSISSAFFMPAFIITINSQFSTVSGNTCRILRPACVLPTVAILHRRDSEHAHPTPQHIGGHAGVGADNISFQAPSDGDRLVPLADNTCELGKLAVIDNVCPKGEGNNLRSLCKVPTNDWKDDIMEIFLQTC